MSNNKEKCKKLKEIRKVLADEIGIDLDQKECTYEGECSGTCPKCRNEEEKLNKALLGKTAAVAVAASLILCGCNTSTENPESSSIPEETPANSELAEENIAGGLSVPGWDSNYID